MKFQASSSSGSDSDSAFFFSSRVTFLLSASLALVACGTKDKPAADPQPSPATAVEQPPPPPSSPAELLPPAPPLPAVPAGLPALPELPATTAEVVAYGAFLFEEPRLASDGKTSCAACHLPDAGYSGARRPTALGRPNLRRALPLINVAWQRELGWDGRFASLEEHLGPHLHGQLGHTLDDALIALAADPARGPLLAAHQRRAFPPGPGAATTATDGEKATAALAAFLRTRYAGDSRWDAEERLSDEESTPEGKTLRAGYALFMGKAQCSVCHPPPLYTDLSYHRIGLIASADEGRGNVKGAPPAMRGAFKTPTLRAAAHRPRFFHDASVTTLPAAADWHLAGGVGQRADRSIIDPALRPIELTLGERGQLLAFLASLSQPAKPADPADPIAKPPARLDPSGYPTPPQLVPAPAAPP